MACLLQNEAVEYIISICTDPKTMILNMHKLRHHKIVYVCCLQHCTILIMYGGLLTDSMFIQSLPLLLKDATHKACYGHSQHLG